MSAHRPLTTIAIAAGVGTVAALALGPIASAATTHAGTREAQTATVSADSLAHSGARTLALADTGVDTLPYTMGGGAFLVAGVGMIFVSRRFSH